MHQLRHLQLMRQVAEVRDLQRLIAEAEVGRANARFAEAEAERESRVARLAEGQRQWTASLSGPRLQIEISTAWAGAVLTSAEELVVAGEQAAEVRSAREGAMSQWRDAVVSADVATEWTREARRDLARHLDEIAMNEVADRTARRPVAR